jgi:hypothetical protein
VGLLLPAFQIAKRRLRVAEADRIDWFDIGVLRQFLKAPASPQTFGHLLGSSSDVFHGTEASLAAFPRAAALQTCRTP